MKYMYARVNSMNLLMSNGLLMEEMKWINKGLKLQIRSLIAKFRFVTEVNLLNCTAYFLEKGVKVLFSEKIRAIAPGPVCRFI